MYRPGEAYWCDGLWACDVIPSPKSHSHCVGFPVLVSVKSTSRGATPESGAATKAASGGSPRTMRSVALDVSEQTPLSTIKVTVYVPGTV